MSDKYDLNLLWQPFSAKAAGQSLPATAVNPDKLSYLFEDTKRYSELYSIPLVYPEGWPENEFDPGRITRGALVAQDMEILKEYNIIVFHKCWGLGQNPNEEIFTTELCEELDIDLGEFLSKVSSSDTRDRVKGIYKRGKKYSVFDTPTFVIDNERFFGIDKIPFLERKFQNMGLARRSAA
jgi:2-hydroxychromene-2-carboxylate isomerase